ncbi:MAG: hypothetical protein H6873_05510 [Hyphomicrobiaceae bacterium]|nr:hypothetical protein [Hyphomicrobiaceae bacterium]
MLSPADLLRLKAAVRRDVERAGGQEAAALIPGIRVSRHQSYSEFGNPDLLEKWPGIDLVVALARDGGKSRTIEEMCAQAGGLFVPLPRGSGLSGIEISAGASAKEFGDVMITVGASIRDGRITPDEAERIGKEINEALAALAGLRETVVAERDRGEGEGRG